MGLLASDTLADPSRIAPYSKEGVLQVVIETPKNSRNKYTFDPDRRVMMLKKVLPMGMRFPYDFGFVPSTRAADGDPIDVLLLMDEPGVPGCVVDARVIGVILGEDELPNGTRRRNDRVLAVAEVSHTFAEVHSLNGLPQRMIVHIGEFFASYPRLLGDKIYTLLGTGGPDEARKLIEAARQAA